MQRYNPAEFPQIYGIQVVFGTNPPLPQDKLEKLLEDIVSFHLEEGKERTPEGKKYDFYFETGEFNIRGKDPRSPMMQLEDAKRADEFAEKGSLKHYLLRKGFFPNNEADAEAILDRIIQEHSEGQ